MSANSEIDVFADRQFDDFDNMSEALTGWDLTVRQIDRGEFSGRLFHARVGQTEVVATEYHRRMLLEGAPPSGLWTFAVLASDDGRCIWQRQEVTSDDVLIFPGRGEFSGVTDDQYRLVAVSLSEETLQNACERNQITVPLSGLLRCERVPSRSVTCLRHRLEDVVNGWWSFKSTDIVHWQKSVADIVVQILSRDAAIHYSPLTQLQDRALRQAESLIRQYRGQSLSVGELSAAVKVSQRTLRAAFVKYFGVAPAAYMIAVRLNGVRRDLKQGRFRSIHDVASRWGFWHMGQFAADYRRHFGELPSMTVERRYW